MSSTRAARQLLAMPLLGLDVVLPGGELAHWEFARRPRPRLAYGRTSRDARHLTPTTFHVVGGSYRIVFGRLVETDGPTGLTFVDPAHTRLAPRLRPAFARGHGGEAPTVAVRGTLARRPAVPVLVGGCAAIYYGDAKRSGDGRARYVHAIASGCRPTVETDASGTQLFLTGGALAVVDGWLHDVPAAAGRA